MKERGYPFVFDAENALKAASLTLAGLTSTWKYKLQESDRKEIIAEAVAKAWCHRDSFNPAKASFRTWVGRITRNTLPDHIRKTKSKLLTPASAYESMTEKSPDALMMEDEGLELIQRAVERLPESYRNIISLLSDGKGPQDIAKFLKCSSNAATIRCCRARKALNKILQENLQERKLPQV